MGQINKVRGSKKTVENNTKHKVRVFKNTGGQNKQDEGSKKSRGRKKKGGGGQKKTVENNTKNKVRVSKKQVVKNFKGVVK